MARLGFPKNFLIYFEIPDTADEAVHGNIVSLAKSAEEKGSCRVLVWKKVRRQRVGQVVIHTFVFLPGSPPR